MMKRRLEGILYILLISIYTCRTPYKPAPIATNSNFLVVEGLINISDSTFINLSRTVNVSAKTATKPELKAVITIESNTGSSYPLKEIGNGLYSAPSYNLNAANQYQLRIKTSNNNTYTSDFTAAKVTPPIDSLIADMRPDGIHFSVNAHDATGNTRYYRWDFNETWQFTSYFQSHYTAQSSRTSPAAMWPGFVGSGILVLPRTDDIYHCWGNNTSHLITLNTTAGLSGDVVQKQELNIVNSSSEKLSIRYSILVRQYALTKDAYDYWTLLQKNTEQLGSIFDSQPSASIGNIHNVNVPTEPVIGYISVSTVSQKRIYINYTNLPRSYIADYLNNTPYNSNTCALATFTDGNGSTKLCCYVQYIDPKSSTPEFQEYENFISNYPYTTLMPIDSIDSVNLKVTPPKGRHTGSTAICVDCTLRGTNVKPAFWK